MQHILMKQATRRPYSAIPKVKNDIQYDTVKGYWVSNQTPLVSTEEYLNGAQCSKKCDQETGEDQKGE